MGFVGCIPRFVKAHAGWILSWLSGVGLIGTAWLMAKEAPEASAAVAGAEFDHVDQWLCEHGNDIWVDNTKYEFTTYPEEAYLSRWEAFKIYVSYIWPAILAGSGTLACIFGAQIVNAKQQAALISALGALTLQFDQYRETVKDEVGEEKEKELYIQSQKRIRELEGELKALKEQNGPQLWEFAFLPGIIFEQTAEHMTKTFMHFNRNLQLKGENDLAELCDFAGLPDDIYNRETLAEYGWQTYENDVGFGQNYVDFMVVRKKNRDGRVINIVTTYVPPYEIDVDYGFEADVSERIFPDYDIFKAEHYAEETSWDEVIQVKAGWDIQAQQVFPSGNITVTEF